MYIAPTARRMPSPPLPSVREARPVSAALVRRRRVRPAAYVMPVRAFATPPQSRPATFVEPPRVRPLGPMGSPPSFFQHALPARDNLLPSPRAPFTPFARLFMFQEAFSLYPSSHTSPPTGTMGPNRELGVRSRGW